MTGAVPSALSSNVLVLNRSYRAIHVVNVKRAFSLLLKELAEIIHIEDGQYANYNFESWRELSELKAEFEQRQSHEDWLQSINFTIQVPRVIRLLSYDRVPRQKLRLNRRNIFARDGHRCQYCNKHLPSSELSFDHVIPRSRGGETTWENIVCACIECNVRKGNRTPKEAGMMLVKKPVRPKHSPLLAVHLGNPKYESWRQFLSNAYWSVDLK